MLRPQDVLDGRTSALAMSLVAAFVLAVLSFDPASAAVEAETGRPNIVLLLADDK